MATVTSTRHNPAVQRTVGGMRQRPVVYVSRGIKRARRGVLLVVATANLLRQPWHIHDPVDVGNCTVRCRRCWRRPEHNGVGLRWVL